MFTNGTNNHFAYLQLQLLHLGELTDLIAAKQVPLQTSNETNKHI